ncbi:MAG TPA: methyltransferase domain-containing protein [Solirubrobacteraceae bacterium]|nr:methyltransferase domain-containing protein [Solirubrobacteraceae bacterium]
MKAYYEDVWERVGEDPEPWAWRWRRGLLLGEARSGERVLDLGCGAGRFVAALRDAGADPVGVEIAEAALARARHNVPDADLRLAPDGGPLPLEDASIDLAWCSEVLEHVPDTAGVLSEVRRVLRTGGRLLVTTPSHGPLRRTLIALARFDAHFDPLGQHVRFYSRASLSGALGEFAFDDVRVTATGGPPGLRSSLVARARKASLV